MPNEQKPKVQPGRSLRRREELRRAIPKRGLNFKSLVLRRDIVTTSIIFTLFLLVVGAITVLAKQHAYVDVGQVMTETRVVRVSFRQIDEAQTEALRQQERERAPHVFVLNREYLTELATALNGLPEIAHGKTSILDIPSEIRAQFLLSGPLLEALQPYAVVEEETQEAKPRSTDEWRMWVRELVEEQLPARPTISPDKFAIESLRVNLPLFDTGTSSFPSRDFTEAKPDSASRENNRWQSVVSAAGFPESVAPIVVAALSINPRPLYRLDQKQTEEAAATAAKGVQDVSTDRTAGEVIYRAGDLLTPEQLALIRDEETEFQQNGPWMARWRHAVGTWGTVGLIALMMAAYLIMFYPRITRNPWRVAAIAASCATMLAVGVFVVAEGPAFLYLASVSTTLFIAFMLVIAYDQRLAAMLGVLQCALTSFALDASLAFFLMLVVICGGAILALREVRHRNTLIQAAALAGGIALVGSVMVGLLETPVTNHLGEPIAGAWKQIWSNVGLAGLGAIGIGFVILGILPSVERAFDMTTGMTLVELRDPRQPLLRQLQERAPGTYNHSLQVATVAEAAAEAIGADSLLTYVGALYHDIGKMNKPAYFVENQSGGDNKHAKLSPAMSLLVIIGHVKDGYELAREYNLPRPLLHFIESHHGTTLVEYFYHAAKERAEAEGDADRVDEVEFRYPGPRPRTKEAAILMLADASESATRAMEQPTHKSIETLVRKLSRKRLDDGQFDQCDITLRELTLVEAAVIKTLWSIYHGRIAYPEEEQEEPAEKKESPLRARAS